MVTTSWRQLRRVFFAVTLLASAVVLSCASSKDPRIRFGIMKKEPGGRYQVSKETTRIPLVLSDPEFRFGFDVQHASEGEFVGFVVLHFPPGAEVDTTFGQEGLPMGQSRRPGERTIRTERVQYNRTWWGDFRLQDDRDVGDYRLDIFIDERLVRSIEFTVAPK